MLDQPSIPAPHSFGFPPILGDDPTILILGSLPGIASITQQQYYAHPQNTFWRIMESLFQIDAEAPYEKRCDQVKTAKIAIWDVCHSAQRQGSLDSAIKPTTAVANRINHLLTQHPSIKLIAFNGMAAAKLFKKNIKLNHVVEMIVLPSTSPAYASLRFESKLEKWSKIAS